LSRESCLEPGKEGCKDRQDPVHLFILPFLVQDDTHIPLALPFMVQDDTHIPLALPSSVQDKIPLLLIRRFKTTNRKDS